MSKFFSHNAYKWKFHHLGEQLTKITNNLCLKKRFHNGDIRKFSQINNPLEAQQNDKFTPFLETLNQRRAEARRSILVQVQSAQSFRELHSYCSSLGSVKHMFHYTTGVEPLHFIIVEFEQENDVQNILSASSHVEESLAVPTQSQFLWFRASNRKLGKLKQTRSAKLSIENGTKLVKDDEIQEKLKNCENISEQMRVLHDVTRLNDVGSRLRFLTARQVEATISGMFPNASALPFGSSVNGYGKMGCDLDLVLRLVDRRENNESRLIFHCKAATGTERTMSQRQMETIGDLLHLFLPGCSQVRRILQARVPIIKYHHQLTGVECDLSMTNMSGVYMSDFLYMMGELDERVRPLIFTIRNWAKEVGLTNSSPGRWITNFSLTLLVIAFLQKPLNSPPVLPTLNTLTNLAGPNDKYVTEEGINCSFLRDLSKFKHITTNTESLETLLSEFFVYYSQFDFNSKAVCLNEGVSLTKPEFSPMYIVNPLERGLNVSKNVSIEEVERFKVEVKNAAWILESQENKTSNWGILNVLENRKQVNYLNFAFSSKHGRLVEVSTLFDDSEKEAKDTETEFKNEHVKQEIERIKKTTRDKIKGLESGIKRENSQR